jgi:hypothetical protein
MAETAPQLEFERGVPDAIDSAAAVRVWHCLPLPSQCREVVERAGARLRTLARRRGRASVHATLQLPATIQNVTHAPKSPPKHVVLRNHVSPISHRSSRQTNMLRLKTVMWCLGVSRWCTWWYWKLPVSAKDVYDNHFNSGFFSYVFLNSVKRKHAPIDGRARAASPPLRPRP